MFHALVNPWDAFLPIAPFLLPLLLISLSGWVGSGARWVRVAWWSVALASAANNAVFMLSLNRLAAAGS